MSVSRSSDSSSSSVAVRHPTQRQTHQPPVRHHESWEAELEAEIGSTSVKRNSIHSDDYAHADLHPEFLSPAAAAVSASHPHPPHSSSSRPSSASINRMANNRGPSPQMKPHQPPTPPQHALSSHPSHGHPTSSRLSHYPSHSPRAAGHLPPVSLPPMSLLATRLAPLHVSRSSLSHLSNPPRPLGDSRSASSSQLHSQTQPQPPHQQRLPHSPSAAALAARMGMELPQPNPSPDPASLRSPSPDSDNETSYNPAAPQNELASTAPAALQSMALLASASSSSPASSPAPDASLSSTSGPNHPSLRSAVEKHFISSTASIPLRFHPNTRLNQSPAFVEPMPGANESVLTVWTGTWNLHAKPFPDNLSDWIPRDTFDLYVIGTEECENTIEASLIWASKAKWTKCVTDLLGEGYIEIAQHTLQAIHIIAFIRAPLFAYVHRIETAAVPTGFGSLMGNKGGVGIGFELSLTSLLFINAHFAAHQHKVDQRNADFHAINAKMPLRQRILRKPGKAHLTNVCDRYERVFWLGDLNYRIGGNRRMVDALISKRMIEVMVSNDQLNRAREKGEVFQGFIEGDIAFMPTYKFDHASDRYDTSKKRRIPSYTDRILWKPTSSIELLQYNSVESVRSSDHRPVFATFKVKIQQREQNDLTKLKKYDQSGSKTCAIM